VRRLHHGFLCARPAGPHRDSDRARRSQSAPARGVEQIEASASRYFPRHHRPCATRATVRAPSRITSPATDHGCAPDIGATHIQADAHARVICPDSPENFISARYSRFPAAPSIGDSSVADHVKADLPGELDDTRDRFVPQLFVFDYTALADLALADFGTAA